MKNNFSILFLLVLLLPLSLKGQLIENKINLYTGFSAGKILGPSKVQDKDFIMPSLFNNYQNHTGWQIKAIHRLLPWGSAGLSISNRSAYEWKDDLSWSGHIYIPSVYDGSRTSFTGAGLILRVHTPQQPHGFYNRFRLYLDLTPEAGYSVLKLGKPVNLTLPHQKDTPMAETATFSGFSTTAGLEMSINDFAGVYLGFTYYQNSTNGSFFIDERIRGTLLQAGVFIKMAKDPWIIF